MKINIIIFYSLKLESPLGLNVRATYRKISYTKESYYKLYLKLYPKYIEEEEASSIIDILFISLSN